MSGDPLVQGALDIANRLAASAIEQSGGLTWQAEIITGINGESPVIGFGDIGETLYDGAAGVAIALAAAAQVAGSTEAPMLARTASGAIRAALGRGRDAVDEGRLGLFDGATGVALAAVLVGEILDDNALSAAGTALAQDVMTRVETRLANSDPALALDLIAGLAGIALGWDQMVSLGAALPGPNGTLGTSLAGAAVPQAWGAAWPSDPEHLDGPYLLGLGHGAAGISLALAEMAARGNDPRARDASAEGLAYERGWFDRERGAWPDLRDYDPSTAQPGWMSAWCHGAIGIGLSRVRIAHLTKEPMALAEVTAALQAARSLVIGAGTALRSGQQTDCTCCHGLGGVVELFLVAAQGLNVPAHAHAARRTAQLLLEERDLMDGAWPCGLPGAGMIPGLMTGTAGIALTLLRAAGVSMVPTPLLPGAAGW